MRNRKIIFLFFNQNIIVGTQKKHIETVRTPNTYAKNYGYENITILRWKFGLSKPVEKSIKGTFCPAEYGSMGVY